MPCTCDAESGFTTVLNVSSLRQAAAKAQALAVGQTPEERVVRIGGHLALASAVDEGKRGCFTIPFLGVPIQLCWEITGFEVSDKVVDVRVKMTISALGQVPFDSIATAL